MVDWRYVNVVICYIFRTFSNDQRHYAYVMIHFMTVGLSNMAQMFSSLWKVCKMHESVILVQG